jgi:GDP-L-fucose synthase
MRTLVAGSHGMIGTNVVNILNATPNALKVADLKFGIDLRKPGMCEGAVTWCDRVFHLADRTAGIGYAQHHHGQMLTDSLLISLNLLEASRAAGVKDYLYVSSSCVYADHYMNEAVPEYYADSYIPEQANEGYGWAKRIAEKQCRYYYLEHGIRTIIVRPANIYGPSYDWTRPVEDMHVIPALITKMLRGDKEIVVWGSGKQRRMFMYETDAAMLMTQRMEKGQAGEAYNLGGAEQSIREVVNELAVLCDYEGAVCYDHSKPEGPQRKAQDTAKIESCLGFPSASSAFISFTSALETTIEAARRALRFP